MEEEGLADTLSIQYVQVPVPCASSSIPNRKMHNQVRCWDLSTQVPPNHFGAHLHLEHFSQGKLHKGNIAFGPLAGLPD